MVWCDAAGRERKKKNQSMQGYGTQLAGICLENFVVPPWHDRIFCGANMVRQHFLSYQFDMTENSVHASEN